MKKIFSLIFGCLIGSWAQAGSDHFVHLQLRPGELTEVCNRRVEKFAFVMQEILRSAPAARNFKNTVVKFDRAWGDIEDLAMYTGSLSFYDAPAALKAESTACLELQDRRVDADSYGNSDLYEVLRHQKPASALEARLQKVILAGFEKRGVLAAPELRHKILQAYARLSQMGREYERNLTEALPPLEITPQEWAELDAKTAALAQPLPNHNYAIAAERIDTESLRTEDFKRKVFYHTKTPAKGPENLALLQEGIKIRRGLAGFLGRKSWSDLRATELMTGNVEAIEKFTNSFRPVLLKKEIERAAALLELKKKAQAGATEVFPWEKSVYLKRYLNEHFPLPANLKPEEYFTLSRIVPRLLGIYQKWLGVDMKLVKGAEVWAPEVQVYQVRDHATKSTLGYFYLDLVDRAGKHKGSITTSFKSHRILANGKTSLPVAVCSMILKNRTETGDYLIDPKQIKSLFHEFGHLFHAVLNRAPYWHLNNWMTEGDFSEGPSQMLEFFMADPQVLHEISGHYQNPSTRLPLDVAKILASRERAEQLDWYAFVLAYAIFDNSIHGENFDPAQISPFYRELEDTYLKTDTGPYAAVSRYHLLNGYDARIFGFLLSRALALDFFSTFPKENLFSPEGGTRYRKEILERGASLPGPELAHHFLGRDYDPSALRNFLEGF